MRGLARSDSDPRVVGFPLGSSRAPESPRPAVIRRGPLGDPRAGLPASVVRRQSTGSDWQLFERRAAGQCHSSESTARALRATLREIESAVGMGWDRSDRCRFAATLQLSAEPEPVLLPLPPPPDWLLPPAAAEEAMGESLVASLAPGSARSVPCPTRFWACVITSLASWI